MSKKYLYFLVIIFALGLVACNQAQNYHDAYVVSKNNKYFIKVRGKRNLMVHDLFSLFKSNTYEDSVLIPIPYLANKKISGHEIIFDNGQNKYSYKGYLKINSNKLTVNLYDFDVDNKNQRYDFGWNGDYVLHSNLTARKGVHAHVK